MAGWTAPSASRDNLSLCGEQDLRGLHLVDTGVYKTLSDFIEKTSYFSLQLVVI
jgi:hypothetical protein